MLCLDWWWWFWQEFDWICFDQLECFGDCGFELWVVIGNDFFWCLFDFDVWCDVFVFYCLVVFGVDEVIVWCGDEVIVDQGWCVLDVDEFVLGVCIDEWIDVFVVEYLWYQVIVGIGGFVDDYYFWVLEICLGIGLGMMVVDWVVEVVLQCVCYDVDDVVGCGVIVVEVFVDDGVFVVLLSEVVVIEVGVVIEVSVGQLYVC